MRNVFDQYSQPENRLTHALMVALAQDPRLARAFLLDLADVRFPRASKITLTEQKLPGQPEPTEDEAERRGLPDGCIVDDEGLCVAIEAKVESDFTAPQIERHRRTLERAGYPQSLIIGITGHPNPKCTQGLHKCLSWKDVYCWLSEKRADHDWARKTAGFMEIYEAKMAFTGQLRKGAITQFSGIPFGLDHEYSYPEARRLISLLMSELRRDQRLITGLKVNPDTPGRPAITGTNEDRVWDFLSLNAANKAKSFTSYPHLTLGIQANELSISITVPNGVSGPVRRNLMSLGTTGFQEVITKIVGNMEAIEGWGRDMKPWFNGVQRHYLSQRSVPTIDARIQFDLRTALPSSGKRAKHKVKSQLHWLAAAYESFLEKKGTNYQIQVGAILPYGSSPAISSRRCIKLVSDVWLSCKPFLDAALKS